MGTVLGIGKPDNFSSLSIGSASHYVEFESDGTLHNIGDASYWLDELGDVSNLQKVGVGIEYNPAEGCVDFLKTANTADYLYTNLQINHDWKAGTSLHPHIHWWQTTANVPNWVILYRWQRQGEPKTTAWTPFLLGSNAFTYTSGILDQITSFADIAAPSGYHQVSDIIQVRLIRDSAGTYYGNVVDPVNATQSVVSFDIHKECDTLGSRSEYQK